MESKKKVTGEQGADILFSKSVKAGQRIYYIDVKKNHKGEMYLSITESKRIFNDPQDISQVSYEKHKIFLFREDFTKFREAFDEALGFVTDEQGEAEERRAPGDAINIDMEF